MPELGQIVLCDAGDIVAHSCASKAVELRTLRLVEGIGVSMDQEGCMQSKLQQGRGWSYVGAGLRIQALRQCCCAVTLSLN
jgi:hypothetical protein